MADAPERRLTTILSADVAGYSRLMEADEPGTLARLRAYREAFAEKVANHRGRVVSATGDALLAEFASVVNAVDCAVRIQRDLSERNAVLPEASRMAFRIGINLGDVMVEGEDIFGEGVNIAARLQGLAEPGGILVAGNVFEQVKNKLTLAFDYLGLQSVKNISDSVPAYRVLLGEADGAQKPGAREQAASGRPRQATAYALVQNDVSQGAGSLQTEQLWRRAAMAGILIVTLVAINVMWWHGQPWFQWPALVILAIFGLRTVYESRRVRLPPKAMLWRRGATAAILIAFLFAINMFSWSGTLWFQWPALGILLLFGLRTALTGWR